MLRYVNITIIQWARLTFVKLDAIVVVVGTCADNR